MIQRCILGATGRFGTNLVLNDVISKALRKFAYRLYVCVILAIPSSIRSLGNGVKLVLDSFKSSEIGLFDVGA